MIIILLFFSNFQSMTRVKEIIKKLAIGLDAILPFLAGFFG